jgi:hypothetical protein
MEPLFWLFRILFFPLLPLLTAIRARSKGWDELPTREAQLDAQYQQIQDAITGALGPPPPGAELQGLTPAFQDLAQSLRDYQNVAREADRYRYRSKFGFLANLDQRHRRVRNARFWLVYAMEAAERDGAG